MRLPDAVSVLAAGLVLAGCSAQRGVPTDGQMIEDLEAHREEFEQVIDTLSAAPAIWRVEKRGDGQWVVRPEDVDASRLSAVRDFMRDRRIASVSRTAEGQVWFVVYEGAPRGRVYQSKTLIHGHAESPGELVDDSDAAVSGPLPGPRIVFRVIDGDWMIRNSAE